MSRAPRPPSLATRFRHGYEVLRDRQKPGAGVPAYTRWVNRAAARPVAAAAHAAGFSPNSMTFLSLGCSLVGFVALTVMDPRTFAGPLAAVFFAIAYLLDSADGQVARLSGRSSSAGEWLDHVVDAFRAPAMHVAVAVAAWRHGLDDTVFLVALAMSIVVSGQFMSQILAEQLRRGQRAANSADPDSARKGQSWLLLPTDPGVWAWVFVIWSWQDAFAVTFVVLAFANLLHCLASLRRRFRQLSQFASSEY